MVFIEVVQSLDDTGELIVSRFPADGETWDTLFSVADRVAVLYRGRLTELGVRSGSVTAEVVGPAMGDKVYVQKFIRRKNFRRRTGHRQIYTTVRIKQIAQGLGVETPSTSESETPPVPADA